MIKVIQTALCHVVEKAAKGFHLLPLTSAVAWRGELPCRKWDCECAFEHQRGCCCAAPELQEVEDQVFSRMMDLLTGLSQLGEDAVEVIGSQEHLHCSKQYDYVYTCDC